MPTTTAVGPAVRSALSPDRVRGAVQALEDQYQAEISRRNPTAFIFLVDQSISMGQTWGAKTESKAERVARALNELLFELCLRAAKDEGVRNIYHVGIFGYGTDVGPCLSGNLSGRKLIPIADIAAHPARLESDPNAEGDPPYPVWIDPQADGYTPMCRALSLAADCVKEWVIQHPNSYPPTVINITDGEANDGDPVPVAESVTQHRTSDGRTLLFNIHISSSNAAPIAFPSNDSSLPDIHAQALFRMSSKLPRRIVAEARRSNLDLSMDARGFAFNANVQQFIQFLDLGTRTGFSG